MFRIPRLCCSSVIFRTIISGVLAVCIVTSPALADKPVDPKEQSVPVQLTLIRDYLADMDFRLFERLDLMELNLSTQMLDMQGSLDASLDDIQAGVNFNSDKLLYVQGMADAIYAEMTAVKMSMKTELCLDEGVMAGLEGGAHGEFGVGWPNVLDAKLALQGDAGFGVEVGLANTICIEIPLYSVEADTWLLDNADFIDTQEFNDMLASVAGGAQVVVPFWATVWGELMPTPDEALEALENYVIAATGKDLSGTSSSAFEPVDLLYPELLLQPVIPNIFYTFRDQIGPEIKVFASAPCVALAATPLGVVIPFDTNPNLPGDQPDPLIGFMCEASSGVMMTAVTFTEGVVGAISTVINAIRSVLETVFPLLDWG